MYSGMPLVRSSWVSKALISDQKERMASSWIGKEKSFPSHTSSMVAVVVELDGKNKKLGFLTEGEEMLAEWGFCSGSNRRNNEL